ncbi:acetyl-CoA carboxylase carboxyl transferase subunit beta [Amycolatopsis arida]|uniref:Multifunctional fusion protein n=1 Tax=Amycolatopsis arida TaxID=587909 RepID=A0A1I6A893_9PSEU|nr:acetyl-CoA carboxylase, carboxyltransferase subunit beta [Amycolatopsis arida]TDX88531.1 acetyl-CoA carboxylase carboxyl transferase subunit beta [Amycolatopsis arida]SFQ64843.1 acetyl-CoA carboxylase carboxyl transferase subunit beta [Amycolatopsis arida]
MTEVVTATAVDSDEQPDWTRCQSCGELLYLRRFLRDMSVCPGCGWHAPLDPTCRISQLLDEGSGKEVPVAATVRDPLGFADLRSYADRFAEARRRSGAERGVVAVRGTIEGQPLVLAVMDFRFLGGSLGSAEGEAVTAAAEAALADRVPLVIVTASGGARMQEGMLSLMQMAKTSGAIQQLDDAGLLTVTVLTDPTYGGVAASFATLSDVVLAEQGARMGFAGPRVIQQTIRQELPPGFQTAEFLMERGLVDGVVRRTALRGVLARLIAVAGHRFASRPDVADPVVRDVRELSPESRERDPANVVGLARQSGRPTALDHAEHWLDGFFELHGDRAGNDCPAIVGGIGWLDGKPVVMVGHQKGHTTADLMRRNFGMPSPAGYRKSARLLRFAAKLGLPVVSLIDTPGAHPGLQAEETGQAHAIADNLRLLSGLPVPVVAVVTGEGGSGGALALGIADEVLMCENSIYSVISPEGCAAILWKQPSATADAARALRLDAASLLELRVVDGIVPEPPGGAHTDPVAAADLVRRALTAALNRLAGLDPVELLRGRRARFRVFGLSTEPAEPTEPPTDVEECGL